MERAYVFVAKERTLAPQLTGSARAAKREPGMRRCFVPSGVRTREVTETTAKPAVTAAFASGVAAPAVAGDASAGAKVFKKCAACHTLEADKHKIGPSLVGVLGRTAATVDSYTKYSADMKAAGAAGLVWTEKMLADYINKADGSSPKAFVGGYIGKGKAKIKMAFPGLKTETEVADLLAYLNQNGGAVK